MIFCHYSRRIKMVPGGLGHVQKKLVIFVHHFPNLHTKSFIEDRVNRLHRHLRFENLQFQVYIRNQQDHNSHCQFFLSNWLTFLLLAAMLTLFRLWGRTNTFKANYPRLKVCFQKNINNYFDKVNLHKRITFSEHVHFWKPLQSGHRLSSEDIAE